MSSRVKIIVFWALMVGSVGFLWWAIKQDPKQSLWVAAFVVPFVLLVSWFPTRFAGPRRRTATIMVNWAIGAMVAGSLAVWKFTLLRSGYQERQSMVEAVIAGAIFVVCSSVSVWSLLRPRKSAATN